MGKHTIAALYRFDRLVTSGIFDEAMPEMQHV